MAPHQKTIKPNKEEKNTPVVVNKPVVSKPAIVKIKKKKKSVT
jgi:hypothetical protein